MIGPTDLGCTPSTGVSLKTVGCAHPPAGLGINLVTLHGTSALALVVDCTGDPAGGWPPILLNDTPSTGRACAVKGMML